MIEFRCGVRLKFYRPRSRAGLADAARSGHAYLRDQGSLLLDWRQRPRPSKVNPLSLDGGRIRLDHARRRRIFRQWKQSSNAIAVLSTNGLKESS